MAKEQIKVSEVKRTRQKGGAVVTVDEFLSLKNPKGDLILKAGREQVSVTSLDRIYWPDEKLTKFDLLSYYLHVADSLRKFQLFAVFRGSHQLLHGGIQRRLR